MIKGVIFDLDGVLVSTDSLHYIAWKYIADKEGIFFDETINHKLRGVSRMASLDIILENAEKIYTDHQKLELATIKNDYYVKLLDDLTEKSLLPGAVELLTKLQERNIKLAIGSSSKNAVKILEKTNILKYFDAISDGNHIKHSKPHPEVFIHAQNLLSLKAKNCIVIEDAKSGIDAANAAHMVSVGLNDAYDYDLATFRVKNLLEILDILGNLHIV